MTLLIIGLFITAALLSIPIAHSLVLASVAGLFIIDRVPVHLAVEQMITQTQSFPLIAIPFFMMTGALMVSGKLGQSLVSLLTMMIGRVHGGPAQVGVLSSTIFGGVSGSAVADASHDRLRAGLRCVDWCFVCRRYLAWSVDVRRLHARVLRAGTSSQFST